jgi:hypothetical protein
MLKGHVVATNTLNNIVVRKVPLFDDSGQDLAPIGQRSMSCSSVWPSTTVS